MSTEPSPSGPDQQEPVAEASEVMPAAPVAPAAGSQEPAAPEQTGEPAQKVQPEQHPDTEPAATEQTGGASAVVAAVSGVLGGLAKDVTGAAQALLSRGDPNPSEDTSSDESRASQETPSGTTAAEQSHESFEGATSGAPTVVDQARAADETPATDQAAVDAPTREADATPEPETPTPEADVPAPEPETPAADPPTADTPAVDTPAVDTPKPAPTPATVPIPTAPTHDAPRPSDVMPSRAHVPAPTAAVTPPLAIGAASFGRVDEAGVVHVRDGDTEREVGQYPDVPHEEALAFYVRKFEDLAAQVHLLGQRLDNGTVPAKEARSSLATLRTTAAEAKAVGDLPALRIELDRLDRLVADRTKAEDAQRAAARAKALTEREAIVAEAEQIAATPAQSMHFKNAGERMQTLLEEWKSAQRSGTRLDKRSEDPLWKRFAAARSSVDRMRRAHFAQVSDQRSETKSAKEQLIVRAEELQTSTDWRSGSEEYRTLMDRWKSSGRLSRKDDDALWARFRAAQDVFFAARAAANSAQDEEYRTNLEVKEKLLLEAEALLPVTDPDRARKALGSIQDRWDDAGRVPRGDLDRIEGRLRVVIEKIRDADSAKWGKGKPEVVARGSGLVLQLRQQVADLEAKRAEAEARGDTRTASRSAKERDTKQAWLDQAEASLDDISR